MRYVSVFSGVEAATLAWHQLGWEPVAFSEIDPFPSAVLAERFPDVPNLGDITKVDWSEIGSVDLVVGGSPCQSFSVAGKREGLAGASGLMFEYIRCVRELRPRWFVWENVPGALSSEGGAAFGLLLTEMDDIGYGLAWRVLDAQFFGVAQRRRRVFLVGSLGDGGAERACEVLFESDSLLWDPPSSREKRKALAARAPGGAGGAIPINMMIATRHNKLGRGTGFGVSDDGDPAYTVTAVHGHAVCAGFKFHQGSGAGGIGYIPEQSPTLTAGWHNPAVFCMADDNVRAAIDEGMAGALKASGSQPVVCMNDTQANSMVDVEVCGTLSCHSRKDPPVASTDAVVRRLTPRECERLQGMPDDWTRIPYRGKPAEDCPDGPRYTAIGNSMAVPVMRWIGERIAMVDKLEGRYE